MSSDSGQTWGKIDEGLLGNPILYSMAINPFTNELYATTPFGIFKLGKK